MKHSELNGSKYCSPPNRLRSSSCFVRI